MLAHFEPIADFTWDGACGNAPVQFTDLSTTAGGMQSWTWNFGDGTGYNLQNPVHTFPGSGTYNVSLIVENIYGCTDTIIQQVIIAPLPVASFSADTVCADHRYHFTNTSTPPGTSWSWLFSNGGHSNSSKSFGSMGPPEVILLHLVVTDSAGCSDTITQNVAVNPQPAAVYSQGNNCQGVPITFNNTSPAEPQGISGILEMDPYYFS
ncbi:MAG: PKD domain-containing protein [Bacteroidetes bacterium]|nr:PKD domain-containing protein [Bacteroidota bacterium]